MTKAQKELEEAATDLLLAMGQIVRKLRLESASHELTWTQVAVMARLDRGGPATTADLARAEAIKPQSMGATLAYLQEQGVVERRAHPTDGRQFVFSLTEAGHRIRERASADKRAWLMKAMAELSPEERQALLAAIGPMRRLVRP